MQIKIEEKTKKLMKKIGLIYLIIISTGLFYFLFPVVYDEIRWYLTELRDTQRAYSNYSGSGLASYDSEEKQSFLNQCSKVLTDRWLEQRHDVDLMFILTKSNSKPRISEKLFWWWMVLDNSEDSYMEYIDTYQKGKYETKAWKNLYELIWTKASQENTIISYQQYLDKIKEYDQFVPKYGSENNYVQMDVEVYNSVKKDAVRHLITAKENIQKLKADIKPYNKALKKNNPYAWATYLENYPGHYQSIEAVKSLAEAKPASIFYLVKQKLIEISPHIDKEKGFGVSIKSKSKKSLYLFAPKGLYLKGKDNKFMDFLLFDTFDYGGVSMTIFPDHEIIFMRLEPYELREFYFPVLSIGNNVTNPLENKQNNYTLLPNPPNENLTRLIAYTAFKHIRFWTAQTAVWIVSNNLRLKDLDSYFHNPLNKNNGQAYLFYTSTDYYNHVYEAMKLIKESGLDLQKFAIWEDRDKLFWNSSNWHLINESFLANEDPQGIGYKWDSLKKTMSQELSSPDLQFLKNLKASYFDIVIKAPEESHSAAWFYWYLHETGINVYYEPAEVSSNSLIMYKDAVVRKAGDDLGNIVQKVLNLKVLKKTEYSLLLQGGSFNITVYPNDTYLRKRLKNGTKFSK